MAASTGKSSTRYSTDPYGIIERGVPGGGSGPSFSVGRVGTPVASLASPGRSFGTGVGGRLTIPVGKNEPTEVKKKATGGLAVKPVWDKKRPKDLDKPKALSVKKKKAAKARAAAAGRPYPNLIDNMAVARKKGK
jgi:hypothetical protein